MTSHPSVSVLLIGASGVLGRELLTEFIRQQSSFSRIAILAATPTKAQTPFFQDAAKSVEIVIGDILSPSTYIGFTHVISCVGNALMGLQPQIIDAAIAGGVSHFYPSEWNSDISQPAIAGMRYFRDKQATRAHLERKAKELGNEDETGLPKFKYTLMITGIFTEWSVLPFYGFDHENFKAEIYGRPEARVGVTSINDITRYTVTSLLLPYRPDSPSESGRTIRVQGSSQMFSELISALENARGKKYAITYVDPGRASDNEEKARLAGDENEQMMWSIRPLVASGYGVADGTRSLDNEIFDFKPEGLENAFRRIYSSA